MRALNASGIRPPELLLFSPGVLSDAGDLATLDTPDTLRPELRGVGQGRALPVAMGGYIAARAATGDVNEIREQPEDADGCCFAGALIGLLSGDPESDADIEETPESEGGIDLGLPASAGFADFTSGAAETAIVTQADIAQLTRLRDAGRGPDWTLDAAGEYMWADQLLLAGVVAQTDGDAAERMALARALVAALLDEESQQALSSIGALSVTNARIYSELSAYAPLETLAHRCKLVAPRTFGDAHGDCQAIVRKFIGGEISAPEALEQLAAMR